VSRIIVAELLLGVPALAFTLWPLLRGNGVQALLPLPPDPRERLLENKRRLLDALRELAFEHETGHVSDDDYADRRTRYECEAAAVLRELDRVIVPTAPRPEKASASSPGRPLWTHPVMAGAGALGLVLFGILLGAGVVRNTTPDPMAGQAPPGSRPLADLRGPASPDAGESVGAALPAVTPDALQGMLQAARASLFAGRYGEAIAAYQAVLKRDAKNVDALTHLGLVVAIGGRTDAALETLDKALTINPNYPPALLYRGQLLAEVKHDVPGAIRSWEKFVAVVPEGEDRQRVVRMIAEAKSGAAQKAPQ
jgi:tetratricopeptide (TPR) repeat protein